ncbi:MAG: PorT family protein [Bacteroides sp.]|nr:PorT family protein [Bacteroides sp.]
MKKKIFSIFCVAMAAMCPQFVSAADGDDAQFRFGVDASVVMSKPSDFSKSVGAGFGVGVVGEYDFTSPVKGLFIGSGLGIVSKPWHSSIFKIDDVVLRQKTTPYYLRLPVNVGYRFALSSDCSLHVQTGPYVSVGLFGKSKQSLSMTADDGTHRNYTDNVNCFGEICKRFDWGWSAGIGVQLMESWQLNCRGSYQFNSFLKGMKTHNRILEIGVAYYF